MRFKTNFCDRVSLESDTIPTYLLSIACNMDGVSFGFPLVQTYFIPFSWNDTNKIRLKRSGLSFSTNNNVIFRMLNE